MYFLNPNICVVSSGSLTDDGFLLTALMAFLCARGLIRGNWNFIKMVKISFYGLIKKVIESLQK